MLRSFSCWDSVGDMRFRSLVGFMKESSGWYHNIMVTVVHSYISKKKSIHPDAPCAPCESGGPGA